MKSAGVPVHRRLTTTQQMKRERKQMREKKKRSPAFYGCLAALALIASYVESLVPLPVPVPGIRLGLANAVVLAALELFGVREAFLVSVVRIVLAGFLFGNLSAIFYSLGGGALSLAVMAFLWKSGKFGCFGISMAGGVSHNMGQLLVASLVVQNFSLFYYFPVLLGAGVLTGAIIGILDEEILKRIRKRGYGT